MVCVCVRACICVCACISGTERQEFAKLFFTNFFVIGYRLKILYVLLYMKPIMKLKNEKKIYEITVFVTERYIISLRLLAINMEGS